MNKDSKLLAEAYESIHKTWRVYLDRPGSGWKEIVKAKTAEQALKIANKKHSFDPTDINSVDEVPSDYEEQKAKEAEISRYEDEGADGFLISLFKAGYLEDLSKLPEPQAKALQNWIDRQKRVNSHQF
jgi:hypothetical protein